MRPFCILLVILCAVSTNGAGGEACVVPVASAEKLGPREFRISVTYFNCGGQFDRDYVAFIHFDRSERGHDLLALPGPGPRPMAGDVRTSAWEANASSTVPFPPVTLPATMKREIFVKAGMYDAKGDGKRLPLIGADSSLRVLAGRLVPREDGWEFVRARPSKSEIESEKIGVRPRALVRPMPAPPAVRFGEIDLDTWRIECTGGAAASAERTREDLCWSEASLKITYTGEGRQSAFVIRPLEPMPVPAAADVARLWLMGRAIGWNRNPTDEDPILWHYLEFRDNDGKTRQLRFRQRIGYPFWYVARRRLPQDWPRPLMWTGAGFVGCTNRKPRSLVLDALVFAREDLAGTLTTAVRLDDLPFPSDPDGLLPSQLTQPFANRIEKTEGGCALCYEGKDGKLRYEVHPRTGTLDDIDVVWSGLEKDTRPNRFKIAAEGGPVIELDGRTHRPSAGGLKRTCLSFAIEAERARARWRCEAGGKSAEYAMDFGIKAKSLIIEVEASGEALAAFDLGHIEGTPDARFVPVPYWTWQVWDYGRDGGVALVGDLFVSGFVDWYRSKASCVTFGPPKISHRPEALLKTNVCFAPGVEYETRSDGHRNPLHERFIFTVSPDVCETFPNIPHPPSPNREKLASYVHYTGGQASRLKEQLEEWRQLNAYGVNKVYIRHFDGMWSDAPQGPQEWTLAEHAAPAVGDVAVRRYLDELNGMGFLPVLYTNYTDLQPVAAEFDWDKIKLLPDGDISDYCWPGSYPLKPLRAVELEAKYAPRIAERFGTKGSFCDVHTAAAPWGKMDYDARLPGAAQFGTTYRCYAKLLMNERAAYGAVYSEGSVHWLYAGLHDGSDAQLCSPRPYRDPFLVDFDLLKIHPKQMDAGMSWISRYVMWPEDITELGGQEAAQDRFTAATIAFGHQGTFTGYRFRSYRTDIKTYYLIQPLQMLYAMRPTVEIRYHDPKTDKTLSTSDAIRSGAYRESQVTVRYDGGLEIRVNGSFDKDWTVSMNNETYVLPPSGFVCAGPGPTLVFSAKVGEGRVDYRSTPDIRFIDARGHKQRLREFETDGAAILRKTNETAWGVWPLGDRTVLKVHCEPLGLREPLTVTAYDETGEVVSRPVVTVEAGWLALPPGDEAFRFEIEMGP